MDQYRLESEKGNGTFSVVFKATSLKNNVQVAIKCMKKKYDSVDKVRKLKEIQALTILAGHENIIKLIEVLYDQPTGKLALVFELMDMNLYEFMKSKRTELSARNSSKIKYIMFQVLRAIEAMHRRGIFHRDIKPENILISGSQVKLADLGSCKRRFSPHPYTEYISTRWYRAPECLMTDGYYNEKMDIWGFGCVLFEIVAKYPLFPGKDELDQVHRINHILGTPRQELLDRFKSHATHMDFSFPPKKGVDLGLLLPKLQSDLHDLLLRLLAYDPDERISAEQAMQHQYFAQVLIPQITDPRRMMRATFLSTKPQKNNMERSAQPTEGDGDDTTRVHSKISNNTSSNYKDNKKGGIITKPVRLRNSKANFKAQGEVLLSSKLPVLDRSGVAEQQKRMSYYDQKMKQTSSRMK